jgi:alkylation response protein AidB-like acyl-CoA dehydrogenase
MDLNYTPEQQGFRSEVRDWLALHVPAQALQSFDTLEGFEQHRAWEVVMASAGFSSLNWPKALGGRGCDLIEWLIFEEEYYAANAPMRVNQNGILLLGPTLLEFGTQEQKDRFLPPMARCDDMWAQGWSEPNAGSDMAAISSRAIRNGNDFVINGQKTWSTRAIFANWIFGLFRSDPESSHHHGLSYLLVPLGAKGITIRPIKALNGKPAFAEVFFDDVRVSADNLVGEEGQGWNVAMATAGFERGLLLRSPARFQRTAKRLIELYHRYQAQADRDPFIRHAVLQSWMGSEAYNLASYHTVSRILKGAIVGAEASTNKIFWSELDLQMHETAMRILGPRAELIDDPEVNEWLEGFLFAQAGPIYAGSNEIQRNIISERVLGLPKA